jgi:hypothetical protein
MVEPESHGYLNFFFFKQIQCLQTSGLSNFSMGLNDPKIIGGRRSPGDGIINRYEGYSMVKTPAE